MAEDKVLELLSMRWRGQLAAFLSGEGDISKELARSCPSELLSLWFADGYSRRMDSRRSVEWYVNQNLPVPPKVAASILEKNKGGRKSTRRGWAQDQAKRAACYLAMEELKAMEPSISDEAAAKRISKLSHEGEFSYRQVIWNWKKELTRLQQQ